MLRFIALTALIGFLTSPAAAQADELHGGPDYTRIAKALKTKPALTLDAAAVRLVRQDAPARRDSVWDGALIGAGIGAGSGFVWALAQCGTTDTECFMIAGTVGIIGGAAIGAAAGAIADALHK